MKCGKCRYHTEINDLPGLSHGHLILNYNPLSLQLVTNFRDAISKNFILAD